jgi:hypothetical protein
MRYWREYRFWSPLLGQEACRVSMTGDVEAAVQHGRPAADAEYYAIIPAAQGRAHREARERALETIEAAILRGQEPGEVEVA